MCTPLVKIKSVICRSVCWANIKSRGVATTAKRLSDPNGTPGFSEILRLAPEKHANCPRASSRASQRSGRDAPLALRGLDSRGHEQSMQPVEVIYHWWGARR